MIFIYYEPEILGYSWFVTDGDYRHIQQIQDQIDAIEARLTDAPVQYV